MFASNVEFLTSVNFKTYIIDDLRNRKRGLNSRSFE
jgi:hypothetical protein